jgi:hypothetical protein
MQKLMVKESDNSGEMIELSFWQKVRARLCSPLRSIPECRHLTSFWENAKYGYNALACRPVAEALVVGVQYVVCAAVPGDIAEFGCHTGRTAKVLSAAMKLMRAKKRLHLFDSFEGLPASVHAVDRENVHVKTGVWGAGVYKGLDPGQLRRACQKYLPADAVKTHAGWFSESLPKLDPGTKFALIHIDCDLYVSALDVLDFVFKTGTLSDGALVLFDDWNCCRASNDFGERKAWREACDRYQVVVEDAGGYGWAGHRFIVHSYAR